MPSQKPIWLLPLLLLFICIISYLPLSSFLFSLKNDAFIYNFPNKIFFSESIKYGSLPTWNPYLNYGFPIYADPGFAWWQPITWVFGFIGYNAFSFTIEVIFYIYLSGLGMYWLGNVLKFQNWTSFAIGCMFMCSGFFIGNLQHINFITCAAFLPWFIGFWLKFQNQPTQKNILLCGTSAYLLCSGGHPAIPMATGYFTFFFTVFYLFNFIKKNTLLSFVKFQIFLILIILIFLFPILYSYISIEPFYTRFEPANQPNNINTGFTLQSYISFIFPFSTIKNSAWFETDVSMRNAYFSLAGFIFFIIYLIKFHKNKISQLFLFSGLIMLLFSSGGLTKIIIFENLPGLEYIRTNGEFRIFSIFSFIICSAFALDKFILTFSYPHLYFRKKIKLILFFIIICLGFLLILFFQSPLEIGSKPIVEIIKYLIDTINFNTTVFISLIIFLFICMLYFLSFLIKGNFKVFFLVIIVIDLIINSWLMLPITGVSKTSVAEVQSIINKSPEGFPNPTTKKINKIKLSDEETALIGNFQWYAKDFQHSQMDYPSQLKSYSSFLNSKDTLLIKSKIFSFLTSENKENKITISSFNPNNYQFKINTSTQDTLVVLQNNFPGWEITLNNTSLNPIVYAGSFMAINVPSGESILKWKFHPPLFRLIIIWLLIILFFFAYAYNKRNFPNYL